MHILFMDGDKELMRWPVPESILCDYPGFTWQQNVDAREKAVSALIGEIQHKMQKISLRLDHVHFELQAESAMHLVPQSVLDAIPLPIKYHRHI